MARRTTPLTDTEIKKAKPKEKEYSLCDGYGPVSYTHLDVYKRQAQYHHRLIEFLTFLLPCNTTNLLDVASRFCFLIITRISTSFSYLYFQEC